MQNRKDGAAQGTEDRRQDKPSRKDEAKRAPRHGRDERDEGRREFGRDG
jgi:hypothetical protein